MNNTTERIIYWTPRVLGILFALFLSMFALDVFGDGYGFGETILALFMHLIPTFIVVIGLVIAWRWEGVGSILFIAAALSNLVMSGGESWIIFGPLVFIGLLFLFNWLNRVHLQNRSGLDDRQWSN